MPNCCSLCFVVRLNDCCLTSSTVRGSTAFGAIHVAACLVSLYPLTAFFSWSIYLPSSLSATHTSMDLKVLLVLSAITIEIG